MPSNVTPKGTKEELITHYIYEMEDGKVKIDNTDIVHFKMGLDPEDHKTGFSPLKTVLREIYGDESAGQMATALLSNMGVPSILISPKDEYGLTADEADQISKTYQQKVGGKNKGKPLILSGSMNIEKLSFSPKDLDIGALRQVPEERVSAVLGVPAILAGLGAGLKHATYSNARELREFFTESKLIPLWKMVAEELTQQILLPDYESSQVAYAEYDFSEVRALQTDHNELFERMNVGVEGGWVTVGEARQAVGLPTDESQNYYLKPMGTERDYQNDYTHEAQVDMPEAEYTPEVVTEDAEENEDDKGKESFEDKVIKKIDDEYCVIAEDSGKNMGCYPTRELAKRRLEQISRYSNNPKKQND
jgi:HK97 family phage portal protein